MFTNIFILFIKVLRSNTACIWLLHVISEHKISGVFSFSIFGWVRSNEFKPVFSLAEIN